MDRNGLTPGDEIALSQEFEVLRSWQHPNIIAAHDLFLSESHICLVLDSCDGGNLMHRVMNISSLNELVVRDLTRTLLEAVRFMHEHDIVHRDIKFNNLVYSHADDDLTQAVKLSGNPLT